MSDEARFNTSATGGYITDRPPEPISEAGFEAIVQNAIVALTGLPGHLVRPRWQPTPPIQPPPEVNWAASGATRQEVDDFPEIWHDGAARLTGAVGRGVDRMRRHSTLTYLITFYGPQSPDYAEKLRDALYIPQQMEMFKPLKVREVRDLAIAPSEFINGQWVGRVDIEIDFRHQIERVYPILNIEGADVVLNNDQGEKPTVVIVRENIPPPFDY